MCGITDYTYTWPVLLQQPSTKGKNDREHLRVTIDNLV